MAKSEYIVGDAFPLGDLKPARRVREPNPRDEALIKAIRAAAAAAPSQVIPFTFPAGDKPGTVKAAARRLVDDLKVPVNVGFNAGHPNTLLLSRGVLSNRGRRRTT
jgi:hypothetical protein